MNRRGTEPYARWCERPGRETSPAYSILSILPEPPLSPFPVMARPCLLGISQVNQGLDRYKYNV